MKFRPNTNPDPILSKLLSTANVNSAGAVSFRGSRYVETLSTIQAMIDFPADCHPQLRRRALNSAIRAMVHSQKVDRKQIESELTKRYNESKSERMDAFTLLTSYSLTAGQLTGSRKVGPATVTFVKADYGRRFSSRYVQASEYLGYGYTAVPSSYQKVQVRVQARTADEAYHHATEALDIHRGLLCLLLNYSMQFTFGTESAKPINRIIVGGLHTLHDRGGGLASTGFWFEPRWSPIVPLNIQPSSRAKTLALFDKHREKLSDDSAYAGHLRTSLMLYVRALDEFDPDNTLIKIWAALEYLAVGDSQNPEATVKRAAFVFTDANYHEQVLRAIRAERNALVHRGERSDDRRTLCYLVAGYFKELFFFHLWFSTKKKKDYVDSLLDLPKDQQVLRDKVSLFRSAIRIRTPRTRVEV